MFVRSANRLCISTFTAYTGTINVTWFSIRNSNCQTFFNIYLNYDNVKIIDLSICYRPIEDTVDALAELVKEGISYIKKKIKIFLIDTFFETNGIMEN